VTGLDSYEGRVLYCLAMLALQEGVRSISQVEIARRVERRTGRRFSQPSVGRWFTGAWPRDFETQIAFAAELHADPGWLYFGPQHSAAPAPTFGESALGELPTTEPDDGDTEDHHRAPPRRRA